MLWIDRVRTNPFLRQLKHSDGSTEDVEISEIDSNITTTGTPLDSNNLNKIVCGDTQYGGTIVTNIDTINKSGYYTCYGTATGAPNTSYSWFIHHQNSNAGTASATQEAVAYSTTIYKYIRTKANSTWGDWIDLTSTLLWENKTGVQIKTTVGSSLSLSNMPNLSEHVGKTINLYIAYGFDGLVKHSIQLKSASDYIHVTYSRNNSGNDLWLINVCMGNLCSNTWTVATTASNVISSNSIRTDNENHNLKLYKIEVEN